MSLVPSLVVDTSAASLPLKANAPTQFHAYLNLTAGHIKILSFATAAELLRWGEERNWSEARKRTIHELIAQCVVDQSNPGLCEAWATLMGLSKRGGHNLGHADAWIAATALTRDVPLVSDNVRHFAWIPGLRLLTA